jgi:hypothetical protein
MVVIADARFEPGRRSGWLNAADEPFGNQHAKRVVDGLPRDGADLGPRRLRYVIGRQVRAEGHRAQHREALRRDLNPTLTKNGRRLGTHGGLD